MGSLWIQTYRLNLSKPSSQESRGFNHGSVNRSILKPGNIILADEPTGALDPELAQIVTEEMLSLQREKGKTLVVVTHDERVAQACDRQIELLPHTTEHPQRFGE